MPRRKKKVKTVPVGVNTIQVILLNPYSNHPLMRKGGVHQKSKSAERFQTRRETKRLARDWSSSEIIGKDNFFIVHSIIVHSIIVL